MTVPGKYQPDDFKNGLYTFRVAPQAPFTPVASSSTPAPPFRVVLQVPFAPDALNSTPVPPFRAVLTDAPKTTPTSLLAPSIIHGSSIAAPVLSTPTPPLASSTLTQGPSTAAPVSLTPTLLPALSTITNASSKSTPLLSVASASPPPPPLPLTTPPLRLTPRSTMPCLLCGATVNVGTGGIANLSMHQTSRKCRRAYADKEKRAADCMITALFGRKGVLVGEKRKREDGADVNPVPSPSCREN
ncbi:hypothetical protein B0H10DRAFT_1102486 [Mycena sp. CBHHK59/15]|nr:hypothetical protein B0H10DRAFT_1102486 [Mycena sp. CBHHK59/15]